MRPSAGWWRWPSVPPLAVLVALALIAFFWVIRPYRRAPDRRDGGHRQRHRRRRPVPSGRGGSRQHRGGPVGSGPQRDVAPDRVGLRRTAGVRGAPAPVHRRRLARAADAVDLDPGLHRAVSHGHHHRGRTARRRHAADRGRVVADGRAGRGPVAAGPAGPGSSLEVRPGRPGRAGPRCGGRRPGRRARSPDRHRRRPPRPVRWSPATSVGCARSSGTCWPTPDRTPRPARRSRSGSVRAPVEPSSRWPTTGWAWRQRWATACSSASTGATRPGSATDTAPDSGWPSWPPSPRPTTVAPGSSPSPAGAPPSAPELPLA